MKQGGGAIGRLNTANLVAQTASGVWGINEAHALRQGAIWPSNLPGSIANPASSAAQIYSERPGLADGTYYYRHQNVTYQAYTKFNWHESGHWVLLLKVHNRGDMPSGSAAWTNTTLQNETDFNLTSGSWSKYASFVYYPFTRLLMDMNGVIPAIMVWSTTITSLQAVTSTNGAGGVQGYGCNSTNPSIGNSIRYDNSGFYFTGGTFGAQNGNEPIVQQYGISCWANNSNQLNPDNASLASVARAGAWIGCPLDEGGHTFNAVSNAGADSGFGFGGCAGNSGRTWSCGYGEWNAPSVINTLPGYIWVR